MRVDLLIGGGGGLEIGAGIGAGAAAGVGAGAVDDEFVEVDEGGLFSLRDFGAGGCR